MLYLRHKPWLIYIKIKEWVWRGLAERIRQSCDHEREWTGDYALVRSLLFLWNGRKAQRVICDIIQSFHGVFISCDVPLK